MKVVYTLILSLFLSISVHAKNSYEGKVVDVVHGGGYTYLEIEEKTKETFWIAVSGIKVAIGTYVRFDEEMVVTKFESKALNRTFDSIMFASNLQYRTDKQLALIEKYEEKSPYIQEGTISIKELIQNRKSYAGKSVKVRAKVVKASDNIMKRNWIHLQDGTGVDGEVGRVVFTSPKFLPNVGDIVTAQGTVVIDKDFGSGYVYKVIVENSTFQ